MLSKERLGDVDGTIQILTMLNYNLWNYFFTFETENERYGKYKNSLEIFWELFIAGKRCVVWHLEVKVDNALHNK